ncbi:SH3 domain-containing protein [Chryseobacterium sp. SN22]|uniref:SH3 domain-containing protein n=1 Tax=Chryseobacterium sp. SN22 TaxID=2606431 RepID=UPI0011EBA69A|nr:SH3 domain-containing protein [Chryseobacterium sp. SN22]KAA0127775.1 SH3 domain-containing protein [Chryseobacterium sp. SN22]
MKTFFTALFLLTVQFLFAQEEMYADGIFNFEENKPQKIFTDGARIRQSPQVNAQILDSLKANQPVLILKKEKMVLKLGERAASWYKVSYNKNGRNSEGYIWGGSLCTGYRNKNGYDFLLGLTKTITKKDPQFPAEAIQQNIAAVRMMEGNAVIDEISFETGSGESLSYGNFTVESNHKLKNVEFTLKATVSGEACGIPGYDQYILVTGKKLVALPQLMSVGDADVYYHHEEFIFPNDKGGIPNAFIYKMEEMEKDEHDREKKKKASKTYLWDGTAYRLR